VAAQLVARLAAAGIRVGTVTPTEATSSAVQYPDKKGPEAGTLAAALGLGASEQLASLTQVTVVLGARDFNRLVVPQPLC
jgi:LytR cell envelope-related transcriptional attenuator